MESSSKVQECPIHYFCPFRKSHFRLDVVVYCIVASCGYFLLNWLFRWTSRDMDTEFVPELNMCDCKRLKTLSSANFGLYPEPIPGTGHVNVA